MILVMARLRTNNLTIWLDNEEVNYLNYLIKVQYTDKSKLVRRLIEEEYIKVKTQEKDENRLTDRKYLCTES